MFTMMQMREQRERHGERLAMFDADGDGPFSTDPGDYFWMGDADTFDGDLAVCVPGYWEPVGAAS